MSREVLADSGFLLVAGGWDWTGRRLQMRGGTMWRCEVLLHSQDSWEQKTVGANRVDLWWECRFLPAPFPHILSCTYLCLHRRRVPSSTVNFASVCDGGRGAGSEVRRGFLNPRLSLSANWLIVNLRERWGCWKLTCGPVFSLERRRRRDWTSTRTHARTHTLKGSKRACSAAFLGLCMYLFIQAAINTLQLTTPTENSSTSSGPPSFKRLRVRARV